jgi:hypothetical protein
MTCAEVEDQLDLLAAGECDPPTRQAVESHLEHCVRCAVSLAASQRLMALLDLHWNSAGKQRLHARIEAEERKAQRRQGVLPFVRRYAAVAALVLVTLGMGILLPREQPHEAVPGLQLAALVVPEDKLEKREPAGVAMAAFAPGAKTTVMRLPLAGRGGESYRQQLLQAYRAGNLPPPPVVPLAFAIKNTGSRSLEVRLGDASTELSLDVQGKGAVRLPATRLEEPAFLHAQVKRLYPGEKLDVRIDRLIAGSRRRLECIYLTEPGAYTLSARLRLTAGGAATTLTSGTIRIQLDR